MAGAGYTTTCTKIGGRLGRNLPVKPHSTVAKTLAIASLAPDPIDGTTHLAACSRAYWLP